MLDIKLKNNRKYSLIAAGVIIAIAVTGFLASYPILGDRVQKNFSDNAIGSELLEQIYRSNLVLYKDLYDRIHQENVDYAKLYMQITEEELTAGEINNSEILSYMLVDYSSDSLRRHLEEGLNSLLEVWKEEMLDGLAKGIDYLVIDHETEEEIKNTGREIKNIYRDISDTDKSPYVYFVKISYDKIGNISNISVQDENSEVLLKNAQSVMAVDLLRKNLSEGYYSTTGDNVEIDTSIPEREFYNRNEIYLKDMEGKLRKLVIHIDGTPKNVTFVYAMTQEQREMLYAFNKSYDFVMGQKWNLRLQYYDAGAGNVFVTVFIVVFLAALVLTRMHWYCLHQMRAFHMYFEISIAALLCLFCLENLAVDLMINTNNGTFYKFFREYMQFLPGFMEWVLTWGMNIFLSSLLFGGVFYFAVSLSEVFVLGIRGLIRERSLIVKSLKWVGNGCKNLKNKLKIELFHTDLNGEMEQILRKLVFMNFCVLTMIVVMWIIGWIVLVLYSLILYTYIKKYIVEIQEQYKRLLDATGSIAEGNLNTVLNEDFGIFDSCKEELNKIQDGFRKAVNEEVKSQKMKTELITNVSHDLKTPLTAMTTYIELLDDENLTPQQRTEYLAVLKKKSARLKFLIEDLFEVSKANSGNVTLNLMEVDICNLMRQVYLEYEDKVEEAELIFRFAMPEEKVILKLDSQKTYRVFENLYINIIKYAMPCTRVYVNAEKTEQGIWIELKNMSSMELNIPPEELTERFVRGDSARNTEGSGLGLAIARSFVELQGGKLNIEIDGDLFKVIITWEGV